MLQVKDLKETMERVSDGKFKCAKPDRGFTLLELCCVITLVGVLVAFTFPALEKARSRAEGVVCISNLRSLHTVLDNYLLEHNRVWPRPPKSISLDDEALWWKAELRAYGSTDSVWICPSRKREPGRAQPGMLPKTIDYIPALFDSKPGTAYKWSGQPWLIELGDFHNGGNFVLMPDGHVETIKSLF